MLSAAQEIKGLPEGVLLRALADEEGLPPGALLRAIQAVPRGTNHGKGATVAPYGAKPAPSQKDKETERPVLHGSSDPEQLREEAKQHAPVLEDKLKQAVAGIPGAEVAAVREEKAPDRVEEKEAAGKPVETQPDHLAARITAETPEAKDKVAEKLQGLGTVKREDRYDKAGGTNDFRADTHQVIVNHDPGAALKSAEVQVLTPEQHKVAEDTHDLYEKQRTAEANGDTKLAAKLGKQLAAANNEAAKDAERRQSEPKFKFGSTQAHVPPGSEAHNALEAARGKIADEDLAGDGKDIDASHVTVRYGIKDGDTKKLRSYLGQQAPFDVTLGKTASFPPSEHSDGAAVIHAPVESPDLHRMNKEVAKHANFKDSDFDYKPHVTVAYVKPEAAKKYSGMSETAGKKFRVHSVAITDRDGNADEVKLAGPPAKSSMEGGRGESPEPPRRGAVKTASPTVKDSTLRPPRPPQRPGTEKWPVNTPVLVTDPATGKLQAGSIAHFNHGENGSLRRARVVLSDGSKLDGVREENLQRVVPVPAKPEEPWVGVDVDGTLAKYDGFKGAQIIGEPIPAMVERVKQMLADGTNVRIFSARIAGADGNKARSSIEAWSQLHLGAALPITDVKDDKMTKMFDDRAVRVERNTGKILGGEPQE